MKNENIISYLNNVLQNLPKDWLDLTTHRLDIYKEELAKIEFLEGFETLYKANIFTKEALGKLPTAYDYIRLGHPLSTVLEWAVAKTNNLPSENVISFSSNIMPLLAILRKNLVEKKKTLIVYKDKLPKNFNEKTLKQIYDYNFKLMKIEAINDIEYFDGSVVLLTNSDEIGILNNSKNIDFDIQIHPNLGSIVYALYSNEYISEIQHVRRRESIAMTPRDCYSALTQLTDKTQDSNSTINPKNSYKTELLETINTITKSSSKALLASSGLSIQYAVMMGLIHFFREQHIGKDIKIIVPPNCYGGTNDQARRVAATLKDVSVLDLPVDGDNDMVKSTNRVLDKVAKMDAIPLIIVEIPTNPRVEIPNLTTFKEALQKTRKTENNEIAIAPVLIIDQTFCPNVNFLGDNQILADTQVISYVSGSKFPSGGKCTAGYCVTNKKAVHFNDRIEENLILCDNEATNLQVSILAKQMPSMLQRIHYAYKNTRDFVDFIASKLPEAKINFVSNELADQSFTPSVFSLDLPTKGSTVEEKETYKREQNNRLINLMITKIPNESKYCVSYGQLKGCYWTIPATSTQGTTKEGDKDYIARVSVSPNLDLEKHKAVFSEFVETL